MQLCTITPASWLDALAGIRRIPENLRPASCFLSALAMQIAVAKAKGDRGLHPRWL